MSDRELRRTAAMRKITTRAELVKLARELGVRPDWHEPDEQDLHATVVGKSFDNADFWGLDPRDPKSGGPEVELHVILWHGELVDGLWKKHQIVATVNLATLFAWATGHEVESEHLAGKLDALLRANGNEHPRGLRGVRDVIQQRDGYLDAVRERDAEVERLRATVAELSNQLTNADAVRRKLAAATKTEAEWRSLLATEVYRFGERVGSEGENRSLADALRQIIDQVGDHVGKMP